MRYFIRLQDGSKYGPVSFEQLQEYADEGGVLPTAQLELEDGSARLSAADVAGLTFPEASVQRVGQLVKEAQERDFADRQIVRSGWLMVLLAPIVCGFAMCVPWGLFATPFMPIAGIIYANRMPESRIHVAKAVRLIAIAELIGAGVLVVVLIYLMSTGKMPGS